MYPIPTLDNLKKAREEFENIEPRDFFYWSVTKLVSSVIDTNEENIKVDDLVCALMMLLTTWNRNFYRFFVKRKPNMKMKEHFIELEKVISKHLHTLMVLRKETLSNFEQYEQEVKDVFQDFTDALGRVGAAKCLHLLAPQVFPLWDAAILQGYGLEKGKYRHLSDTGRYLEFMKITKNQLDRLVDLDSLTNPLKNLDEYNYCRFTKGIAFE